jgi:thioredoxin 2
MESNVVACGRCGAKNRVKPGTGDLAPVCGKCKTPLPWIVSATDVSFAAELQAGIPVLVDFWAEWCGPCRVVAPILEDLAREEPGRIKIVKLNVDENPAAAGRFGIRSIPTMMLFRDGRPVDTLVGAMSKDALLARLRPYMESVKSA